jgi:hypothetical protein
MTWKSKLFFSAALVVITSMWMSTSRAETIPTTTAGTLGVTAAIGTSKVKPLALFKKTATVLQSVHPSVTLKSITPSTALASENGAGRGGGNTFVCFKDSSWPSILNPQAPSNNSRNKAVQIPDAALSEIQSMALLDFSTSNDFSFSGERVVTELDSDIQGILYPESSLAQVTLAQWQSDPETYGRILDAEFNRYIGRYQRSIPPIFEFLTKARDAIPLSSLSIQNGPVDQIDDWVFVGLPKNCVVSTIINQERGENGSPSNWSVDARLFFHPSNSLINQVAALVHERVYRLYLGKPYQPDCAGAVNFFTNATLTESTTYRQAILFFNTIFGKSDMDSTVSATDQSVLDSALPLPAEY